MNVLLALCALPLQVLAPDRAPAAPVQSPRPNVLVLVLDDVGVDMVGVYGEAPVQAPCTPSIDTLAGQGLLFRNAYTNPWCSASRAQILTGRHGFRTGLGYFINHNMQLSLLDVGETLLPEALPGYDTSAVGKWHLAHPVDNGDGQGLLHPLNSGFGWYAGSFYNPGVGFLGPCCPPGCTSGSTYDYFEWVKTTNGVESCTTTYMTVDTADDAIARAQAMIAPWFLYVAFNAVHVPHHDPPPGLCMPARCPDPPHTCPTSPDDSTPDRTKAVMQALDSEIGRVLSAIYAVDPDVYVILMGDNGTRGMASEGTVGGCFDPLRAKGTVYEAGINVPLIVKGPGVVPGEVSALVSSTDLFATVVDLAGGNVSAEDSVSMLPYLMGSVTPQRQTVYAEEFEPNGLPLAPQTHARAIRNAQYKLIRTTDYTAMPPAVVDEFFGLANDPCESLDLLFTTMTPEEQANYQSLVAELLALGVG